MADNKISSSKKEIYNKLLDVALKYTDDDLVDSDFLKTGLFGYITESMAMMMRDSTIHKSMIYNESFLNTAVIPKTVYNWAKTFNIEVQKAVPSYAEVDITIPSNSITNYMKSTTNAVSDEFKKRYGFSSFSGDYYLILNKEDPIIAGDYYFSLEHSILIQRYAADNDERGGRFIANYIMSEYESTSYQSLRSNKNTSSSSIVNPILTVRNDGTNIIIKARVYQYRRTPYVRQISTNSFLNKVQTFKFTDQFCGAKLFYEENGINEEVDLKYSDMSTNPVKKTAFYNLTDEDEIEILFKTGDEYFMPSSNAKLTIYIYTTKGENVPLAFSGDAIMLISENDIKTLPIVINFNPTNIVGGKNAPTLSEIKTAIINEISTRNTITTKEDLEKYFSVLMNLVEDINNGKVTFRKNRDDVLRRVFNSYLLIRDNSNELTGEIAGSSYLSACVPTNTIDVMLNVSNTSNSAGKYRRFGLDGQELSDDSTSTDFYVCPFLIYLFNSDIKFVKYIYNLTDSTSALSYTEDASTNSDFSGSYYMIPVSANIYRGFGDVSNGLQADRNYVISLVFTTNFVLETSEDRNSKDTPLTKTGSILIKGKSEYTVPSTDIQCSSVQAYDGVFTTTIKLYLPVSESEFIMDVANDSAASYCSTISIGSENKLFNASDYLTFDFSNFIIDSKRNNLIYETNEPLVFYQQMDSIMESNPIISEVNETEQIVGIKEVPVIHSSFFNSNTYSETRRENFIKQLFSYIVLLKANLKRLETSTFFNLKFYNTYGYSHFYNTPNTNIKLNLLIVMTSQYKTGYEDLKAEIRSYIRRIVDKMNDSADGIRISTLNALLTSTNAYGSYIDHVEFVGLNDTFNQYIEKIPVSNELLYTPEWLNIDADSIESMIIFE